MDGAPRAPDAGGLLVILLGLILVLLAIAAGVLLFLATQSLSAPVDLDAAGYQVGMTPLALLVTGAVVMLVFWLGLALIRGSVRRRRRPVREAKEAQRQAELEENIRADERSRAEETHQSALAERDRVHDDELQSRLADRDRERDEEFAGRQRDAEERIRADERSRVERELADRHAAAASSRDAVSGAAAGAGSHAAGTSGQGYAQGGADRSGARTAGDRTDAVNQEGWNASAAAGDRDGYADADGPLDNDGRSDGELDSNRDGAVTAEEAKDRHRPAYRTVADKIMGREPRDEA
jgi:flagellar basal body-associated protein FliL